MTRVSVEVLLLHAQQRRDIRVGRAARVARDLLGSLRIAGAAALLLRAAGAGVRDDAARQAEESRRPEGVRRLLSHPEARRAFRLGEEALGRVLSERPASATP